MRVTQCKLADDKLIFSCFLRMRSVQMLYPLHNHHHQCNFLVSLLSFIFHPYCRSAVFPSLRIHAAEHLRIHTYCACIWIWSRSRDVSFPREFPGVSGDVTMTLAGVYGTGQSDLSLPNLITVVRTQNYWSTWKRRYAPALAAQIDTWNPVRFWQFSLPIYHFITTLLNGRYELHVTLIL